MLVLMPSLKAIDPVERGKLMQAFSKRFGVLAWMAIALVVVTGIIRTNDIIGFSLLVTSNTRYANLLLTKIILAIVMILNGTYMSFILGRKIASFSSAPPASKSAGSGEKSQPSGPPPELLRLQGRMGIISWVQVVLALAILLVVGLI
jgi:uncharacterized membrane protein